MRKIIGKIMIISLVVSVACVACKNTPPNGNKGEQANYKLFYVDGDNLEEYEFKYSSTKDNDVMREMLRRLGNEHEVDKKKVPATVSSKVTSTEYNSKTKVLKIIFDREEYEEKDKNENQNKKLQAFVQTLCQLDSVLYVSFYLDSDILKLDEVGGECEKMSNETFGDSIKGENINIPAKIWYTTQSGNKIISCEEALSYDGKSKKEELIIKKLIEGPDKAGYYRTLPEDTECTNIETRNDICYVTFNDKFLNTNNDADSAKVAVYSVVNSLTELEGIEKVKIQIAGQDCTEHPKDSSIDLSKELSKNVEQQ